MKNKYLTDMSYSRGRYSMHAQGLYESMSGEKAAFIYIDFYKESATPFFFFVTLYDKFNRSRQFQMKSYRDAKELALMWIDAD